LYLPEVMLGMQTAEEIRDGADEGFVEAELITPTAPLVLDAQPSPARGVAAVAAAVAPSSAPPSPSPAPVVSGPAQSPPGGAALQASGGGQETVSKPQAPPDPERVAAVERLRKAEAAVSAETKDAVRRKHELRSIRPQTSTERIIKLAEDMERAALPPEPEPKADRWVDPGKPEGEELLSTLLDMQLDLETNGREAQVVEAALAADLPVGPDGPVVDGAPESRLRRFLHEMRERVLL
jgi:hypothetical protein